MIDEHLDEALERAAEMLALDAKRQMGPIQTKEARNLAGWAEAIRTLNTVAADGGCGYCGQPIQTFSNGTDYCACTTKRPCRHRYFTRPSRERCAACDVIAPFIKDMLGGSYG